MNVPIRWKLLGSYLLLLLVMGGGLFAYLNRSLEKNLIAGVRTNLHSEALLAAFWVERELSDLPNDAPRLALAIGERVRARVTLIAKNGVVLGDSELPSAALATLDNHGDRPEVRAALERGEGSAIRYSTSIGRRMLYVAVPLHQGAAPAGVLRLALPLAQVDAAQHELHASLLVAFGLTALLAVGLSLFLTQVTARILRELADGAQRFGSGDFRGRLPVLGNDELGGLARVMNDMAGRLQAQMERLASERNRLDVILRGMGEGLLVTDSSGKVLLVNPAFRSMFEQHGEVAGRQLIELSRHPALHEHFRAVLSQQRELVCDLLLPGSDERTLLTHWVPLRENGAVIGVVAVFHDISDLRRLERIRRDFVANVSHELRTPVTVIGGYAETLRGGVIQRDPATAERFAAIIHTHAERLTALIGDLLTLSQLESGDFQLNLLPVSLNERVRHSCTLLEPKAVAKGVELCCNELPELTVRADAQRLEQVLVNLLDNAVKYTASGGRVEVGLQRDGAQVLLTVRDTGIGIPPQALPRIFERFYRVDAGRSRSEGGTGLGLAIVKHILQLHGGSIAVESTPGQGSCFFVRLPAAD